MIHQHYFPTRRSSDLGRAGVGGRGAHGTTSGDGTGTMKRPPRAMYSACWARISSRKFQASSSTSSRSEEHTSELQSRENLVCRLLLEKKKKDNKSQRH